MSHSLKPRHIPLLGNCHLQLEPDAEHPERYLVRFCGLDRDPAALAATQKARVGLMLANLRGEAAFPSPLPPRITIGWLDRGGWHPGRSPLAKALADMDVVQHAMAELDADLMMRVALVAAAKQRNGASPLGSPFD